MQSLKEPILRVLSKIYEPSTLVQQKFGRYDMAFKTDPNGRPILLFLGQKDANGKIKGERYARRLILDGEGKIVKDHWDSKGKASS